MTKQNNSPQIVNESIISIVFGISGFFLSLVPIAGMALGIAAVVFSARANRSIGDSAQTLGGRRLAIAGLILGVLSFLIGFIVTIYCLVYGIIIGSLLGVFPGAR